MFLIQKTSKNDLQNRSKFDQKSINKNDSKKKRILIEKLTPKRPQNGPQNRPTIDLGANLAPKRIQEGLRDRIWSIFDRFSIDLGSISDRFGTDLGSIWDRFGIDSRSFFYLTRRRHSTISSQCKLHRHMFKALRKHFQSKLSQFRKSPTRQP